MNTSCGAYWFHEPDEVEWFYLVGGFELLTGLLVLWLPPGRVVGLMLDVGPPCVNTGSGNVPLTSRKAG